VDQITLAQNAADESMRDGAQLIGDWGGKEAQLSFFRHHLLNVAGAMAATVGAADACQLMAEGLLTAEEISVQDAR
jgi:hypothetical protein